MPDNRDYRVRMDLCLPPEAAGYSDQIKADLAPYLQHAVVVNEGQINEERGFIEVERCGHRTGESCDRLARWEVGRGRVL